MNVKLDENLPLRLATLLKDLGHDVHTLHDERLTGHADNEIWEAAQKESRFLIHSGFGFVGLATVCSWFTPWHPGRTSSLAESPTFDWTDWRTISKRQCRRLGSLFCCCHRT
jgi:hypothetical protein